MSMLEPPKARRSFFRKIFSLKRPLPPGSLFETSMTASATPAIAFVTTNQALSRNTTTADTELSNTPTAITGVPPVLGTTSHQSDLPKTKVERNPVPEQRGTHSAPGRSNHQSAGAPASYFGGAHDFKIENPTFIENKVVYKIDSKPFKDPQFIQSFLQNLDSGGTVLLLLDKRRVTGAEVDSSDRDPPPRCHPETRRELLDTLNKWLVGEKRYWDFLWLSGPAGAGKSAVAQTFAEQCQELGLLGASFFFSKLQKRDSSKGVIVTIAYQLANRDAAYNHLITRILSRDPSILDKTLSIQFRKLIVEPFTLLAAQHTAANTTCKPLVVIVDGVDECSDEVAQCQLITLIGDYVRQLADSPCPLLWLVCSRPEWHLKRTFARADPPIDYGREGITCDAEQDVRDVYHILKDGLQKIHDETGWDSTRGQIRGRWPTESKLQTLSQKVGGLPILASVVLHFIGDGSLSPDTQLEICLVYLDAIGEKDKVTPLEALDAFYTQIMIRVPPSVLPTTKRIIAFYILSRSYEHFYRNHLRTYFEKVAEVGRFLGICEDAFSSALRNLHSVIDVPSSELVHEKPLTFFHKSFTDFLQDPTRSQSFALDMDQAYRDITIRALHWYSHLLQSNCGLERCPIRSHNESLPDNVRWFGDEGDDERMDDFLRLNVWDMCIRVEDSRRPGIMAELVKFNFDHFPCKWSGYEDNQFLGFLQRLLKGRGLSSVDDHHDHDLIRFRPSSEVDEALARRFTASLPVHDSLPPYLDRVKEFVFVSLHKPTEEVPSLDDILMALWIGQGERTVLALLLNRSSHD